MRVVFAGTPEVAVPALDAVAASGHELVGVVTRPDAPSGPRPQADAEPGRAARRGARRPRAQARAPARPGVPGRPARARAGLLPGGRVRRAAAAVGARHPAARLGQPALLGAARTGAARRPVQHAIWNNDEVTGATTFRIVKELDAGPTFGVMTERIRPDDTSGDLLERLAEGGAGLLVATLDGIADGSLEARPQQAEGDLVRPEDPGRGRPHRLDPPGDRDRLPGARLHAGARRLDDVRRRAGQGRPGHGHRPERSSPALLEVGKARRARRHRHPRRTPRRRAGPRQEADAGRRLGARPAARGRSACSATS